MSGMAKDLAKMAIMAQMQLIASQAGQTDVSYVFVGGPTTAGVGKIMMTQTTYSVNGDSGSVASSSAVTDITMAAQQMIATVDLITQYAQIIGTGVGGSIPGTVIVPPTGITMAGG